MNKDKWWTKALKTIGLCPAQRDHRTVETLTAAELADILWNLTRGNSSKEELRSQTELSADDFRNEMIYLLAFVQDYAFHIGLGEAGPMIQNAVRDAYGAHLRSFAQQTACKPMPEGEWVGSLYLTSGEYPEPSINNDPIRNLNDRFQLFAEAIRRGGENRSVGECLGKVFAGFCGTDNVAFITEVSIYFHELLIGKTNLAREYSHQIRL
jgi:hypothetical protein